MSLATATPGGGFPVYGAAFADTINEIDPSLRIEPRNTKGSTENLPLLRSGGVDIGLVQGEVATPALTEPGTRLRIVAAMYSSPGMFVVRADSPYAKIADLKGKSVAFGANGSGLTLLARTVLDGIGLDPDRDFHAVYLDHAGEGPVMVIEGRVAALWGAGVGWPGFAAVAKAPSGAHFIVPDGAEIARILARHPMLKPMAIRGGSYRGLDVTLQSVGSWSYVLARPDFPDDLAYRIARALHTGEKLMAARLDQARETTAANTAAAAPRTALIHTGTLRYLREIGVAR